MKSAHFPVSYIKPNQTKKETKQLQEVEKRT